MRKIKAKACSCASCATMKSYIRVLATGAVIGGAIFFVGLCFLAITVALRALP